MFSKNHVQNFFIKQLTAVLFILILSINTQAAKVDNITKLIFFKKDNIPYAIFQESLFHPTEQSYSKGNLVSRGYSESRISVYNIATGKIIAQKELGRTDSAEACLMLGYTTDNLWIYSLKYKSGLQSLDPLTLNRKISQATIYSKLTQDIGRFKEPDWQHIGNYYAVSSIQHKLIVTNQNNEKFYIDIENYIPEKITEPIVLNPSYNENLKNSVSIQNKEWKFDGFDDMKLINGQDTIDNLTFLYGSFIMEQNPKKLFAYFLDNQEKLTAALEPLQKKPLPSNEEKKAMQAIQLQLDGNKTNINALIGGKNPNPHVLQSNANTFFVYSKDDNSDASVIRISKITINESNGVKVDWEQKISGMFYNVASARNTKAFKHFFGDFAPDFDFRHFELFDNHLIVIYLLQVCSINVETGEVEWSFILK